MEVLADTYTLQLYFFDSPIIQAALGLVAIMIVVKAIIVLYNQIPFV
jgi:hypothetical protein